MDIIYNHYKDHPRQTVISRQLTNDFYELYLHENETRLNNEKLHLENEWNCYPCQKKIKNTHPVYVYSCNQCGNKFQANRNITRDLKGQIALVTGGRTKLGHQIVRRLLDCGATVIVTTRHPDEAKKLFERYDNHEYNKRLHIYPNPLDFDHKDVVPSFQLLSNWIESQFGCLDILVNNAAQTIRCREKNKNFEHSQTNRYQEPKFVSSEMINSWQMTLDDLQQQEMEEVFRVNAMAPCLLIQCLKSVLKKSSVNPYIINVNSREGLFQVGMKTKNHIHLNMAKAGLAQLHRTLSNCTIKTYNYKKFRFHLCDPGWISVDEYYEDKRPWIVPPLDEVDGASRIIYPLMKEIGTCSRTRRHYDFMIY